MNKIIIYGAPGTGKTFLATQLAKNLDLKYLELDSIRDEFRKKQNIDQDPFLFLGTTEAYKQFGNRDRDNVINGLLAVRDRMQVDVVEKIESSTTDLVAEAAFIDPNQFSPKYKTILVIQEDDQKHMEQFFNHRKISEENLEFFKAARTIQEYLIQEANELGIEIVSSSGSNSLRKLEN